MATYTIEHNGEKYDVEGTEQDVMNVVSQLSGGSASPEKQVKEVGAVDSVFNLPKATGMAGFVQRGAEAVKNGIKAKDVPSSLFGIANGVLAGAPRNALEKPSTLAKSGVVGLQADVFGKKEREIPSFLKPKSDEGAKLASELELVSSFLPIEEAVGAGSTVSKKLVNDMYVDLAKNGHVKTLKKINEFRELVDGRYAKEQENFGAALKGFVKENPTRTVNLADDFVEMNVKAAYDPVAKAGIEGFQEIKMFANNPNLAKDMTVGQVQELINQLNPKAKNSYFIREFIRTLKERQSEVFDGMQGIRDSYKKVRNAYKLIAPKMKEGRLFTTLKKGINDPDLRAALNNLMTPEQINQFDEIARTEGFKKAVKTVFSFLGRMGAGYVVGGTLLGKLNQRP